MPQVVNRFRRTNKASQSTQTDKIDFEKLSSELHEEGKTVAIEVRSGKKLTSFANRGLFSERPNGSDECSLENLNLVNNDNSCGVEPQSYIDKETEKKTSFICKNISEKAKTTCSSSEYKKRCFEQSRQSASAQAKETIQSFSNTVDAKPISLLQSWSANRGKSSFVCKKRKSHDTAFVNCPKRICQISETTQPEISSRVNDTIASAKSQMPSQSPCVLSPDSKINDSILGCFDTPSDVNNCPCPPNEQASLTSNDQYLIGSQPIREEHSDVLHSYRNEDRISLASNDQYLIGCKPIREERSDVLHNCRNEDGISLASNDQHLIGSQPIRAERSDILHSYRNEDRNSLASNDQHLIGSQPIRAERSDILHSYRNEDGISLASNDQHLIGIQPIKAERSDILHSNRNSLASNDQYLIASKPIREKHSDIFHSDRNEDRISLASNDQYLIGCKPIREERSDVLHSCRNEDGISLASNDQHLIGSQPIREERSDVLHSCRNEDGISLASNDQHLIRSQPIRAERSDIFHSYRNEDRNSLASNDQHLIGSQPIREERSDVLHNYRNGDRVSIGNRQRCPSVATASVPIPSKNTDKSENYSLLTGATGTPVTNYDLINVSDRGSIKFTASIECSTEARAPKKLPMIMRNDSQIERSSIVEAPSFSFDSAARASVENAQLKLFSNSTSCVDNQKVGRSNHHFDRSVHMKYNQVSYEQTKIRDIRVKKSFSGKQLYAQKSETIVYTEKQNYFDDERKVESTVEAWDPQSIGKSFILEQKSPNQNQAFEFFNVQSPFQTPKIQNLNGISLSATPKTFSGFSFASGVLSSSQPKCNSMNHVFSETPARSQIYAEEQTPDVLKTSTLNGSKTPKKVSFLLRNEKQNSNTSSDVYYQFSSYEKKLLYILNFHFFFIMAQNSDHLRILMQAQHSRKLTVLDPELGLVLKQIRATVEDPDDLLKLSHMLFAAAQTASQVGFFLLPMMLKPPKRFQTLVFLSYHHNIVNQIKSVTGAQNFTTIRALVSCVESEFFQSKNSRLIICIGNKLPSFIEILASILENNLLPKIPNVKLRSMHRENFSAHRLQAVLKEKHLVLVTSQQSRFRSVRRSKTLQLTVELG